MNSFRVIFHFDNDNSKTLTVHGVDEHDVVKKIYANNLFFVGSINQQQPLVCINLNQVTYINIYKN